MKCLPHTAFAIMLATCIARAYTSYKTPNNFSDKTAQTTYGSILMGGSTEPDAAMKWMISRMGGGDFLVLRASGSDGYNSYVYNSLGGVNSVETIVFSSRNDALKPEIAEKIRNAEGLWMAGGDQSDYVNYWKDTPVEDAINYLIAEKKVPVGGTSAGCAVMTPVYFGATAGAPTSSEALANPRRNSLTGSIGFNNFIKAPFLDNTISDTHYAQRDRQGRHVAFLTHMLREGLSDVKGIGVDERTAVCIDDKGIAKVFGSNHAYFIRQHCDTPEVCKSNTPLTWMGGVKVYKVKGSNNGSGWLDLTDWETGSGGTWEYWHADNGTLNVTNVPVVQCATRVLSAVESIPPPALDTVSCRKSCNEFGYNLAGQRMQAPQPGYSAAYILIYPHGYRAMRFIANR